MKEMLNFTTDKICSACTSGFLIQLSILSTIEMLKINFISFLTLFSLFSKKTITKEYPLPRIFWPETQEIFIKADDEKNLLTSKVNISLRRISFKGFPKLVLNANNLDISSIRVSMRNRNESEYEVLESVDQKFVSKNQQILIKLENAEVSDVFLEIESTAQFDADPESMLGAYHPYRTKDVVTQFETVFARRVFPCFDDPHFRTKFKLTIQLPINASSDLNTVLFNTPVKHIDWDLKKFEFEETPNPIPVYLVAFAILNSTFYRPVIAMKFKGIPIIFYEHGYEGTEWNWQSIYRDKRSRHVIQKVIKFTLWYCEAVFQSKFDWPKLDFVVTESSVEGMEHPGLIVIHDRRTLEDTSHTIVHEIVHQWTGVKLMNDWWSGFWINEGLTVWMTNKIITLLINMRALPTSTHDYTRYLRSYSEARDLIIETGDIEKDMAVGKSFIDKT